MYLRIKRECKRRKVKLHIETNGLFIITFKYGVVNDAVNGVVNGVVNRRDTLLEYLAQNKKINIKKYIDLIGVSARTAQRDMSLFQKQGLVKFKGAPKTGYYVRV